MKKIFGLTLMLLLIASNCFAMTFSQPVKIGHAGHYQDTDEGGFIFKGTSYNDGNIIKSSNDEYGKGLARWGNGKDALYCEYDSYLSSIRDDRLKFGGKNNFIVKETTGRDILKIESDEGLTIYVLYRQFMYFAYLDIIGYRPDGTWINYINFKQLEKQFFEELSKKYMIDLAYGNHGNKLEYYYDGDFIYTQDDTIVVLYSLWKGWDRLQKGEFRFKWDDEAQWFGVEQIIYKNDSDSKNIKTNQKNNFSQPEKNDITDRIWNKKTDGGNIPREDDGKWKYPLIGVDAFAPFYLDTTSCTYWITGNVATTSCIIYIGGRGASPDGGPGSITPANFQFYTYKSKEGRKIFLKSINGESSGKIFDIWLENDNGFLLSLFWKSSKYSGLDKYL